MENPQAQTNVQITTVDAISLLYYASINVAPQPQTILEGLKNEAIKTYVHLITENERLNAEVARLQKELSNKEVARLQKELSNKEVARLQKELSNKFPVVTLDTCEEPTLVPQPGQD